MSSVYEFDWIARAREYWVLLFIIYVLVRSRKNHNNDNNNDGDDEKTRKETIARWENKSNKHSTVYADNVQSLYVRFDECLSGK